MCGIVGITRPGECPPDAFAAMVDALRHRGPDARGEYRDEHVALGHRRLSILDLSTNGAQPMADGESRAVIVFNGEIYNHRELRGRLPDIRWKSTSDTETILHLFLKFGPSFVTMLNGMFAIAIHDIAGRRLLLYRDRLGEKPLHYHHAGDLLVFASELKALLPHPAFPRAIDERAVREYLLFNYIPAPATIYRAARKLPPGAMLEWKYDAPAATITTYWNADDTLKQSAPPPKDMDGEMESLLIDAVRIRTLSDVPLGCFLSGGIDSTAVALALKQSGAAPIETFTIGFEDADYDESRWAARVAKHLGTTHHAHTVKEEDLLSIVPRLADIYDEPFADASMIPTILLAEWTRRRVTVALSGDGGDEAFLGYDRYTWAETVARRMRHVPASLRRGLAAIGARAPHYRLRTASNGLRYRDEAAIYPAVFAGWNAPVSRRLLARDLRPRRGFASHPIHQLTARWPNLTPAERGGLTDLQHYLPDDILTKVDRATMAASLEARAPFLDHRLVEFAQRLPVEEKIMGDQRKIVLRRYLLRHMPEDLVERPKRGFAVPLKHWFRGKLKSLLHDSLSPAEIGRHGFFSTRAVRQLLDDHERGRGNYERQLWALLCFQLWHRRHVDGK